MHPASPTNCSYKLDATRLVTAHLLHERGWMVAVRDQLVQSQLVLDCPERAVRVLSRKPQTALSGPSTTTPTIQDTELLPSAKYLYWRAVPEASMEQNLSSERP